MGLLSISEMIRIIRKYILRFTALSLAIGLLGAYVINMTQTYTCVLGFKYNHSQAAEGLAPDGTSKLDPYEIQNPVVIQAALNDMGLSNDKEISAKGIRQNISINKVVTELDREISESAALLGEKYDVAATEYEMKFTYDASLGDTFGAKMFNSIIKSYDDFLLTKYYNKETVIDFAKVLASTDADYIVIADTISERIDDTITYLNEMASYNPDYRSVNTGYTFAELASLYENLRDIQYAKYYGNVRAGNLAKDKEMVIKSYQKKVKDLREQMDVDQYISDNYKSEIISFYDSYKETGLYLQAERVQNTVDATNNKDQDVLEDRDLEEYQNTYDEIILNYVDHASNSTDALHTINYYNSIIDSFAADEVPADIKKSLIAKNDVILKEITALSKEYSELANDTLDELFAAEVNDDLQYLILPEVKTDKSVKLIAAFLMIITFGLAIIAAFVYEIIKKNTADKDSSEKEDNQKVIIDTEGMDELHELLYEQYMNDFSEFYMVYQTMVANSDYAPNHAEAFIRWQNPQLGMVSPGKVIDAISDFGLFKELNSWIIEAVCKDLSKLKENKQPMPVVHINCPYSQIIDFGLNDILIDNLTKYGVPAGKICLELSGKDIADYVDDIVLLQEMGIVICIDQFENSMEDMEIVEGVRPELVKMSLDILNADIYATTDEDIMNVTANTMSYFSDIVKKCHDNSVKVCICGIEKKTQDNAVSNLGFDYKQGYYYSKPERKLV